MNLRHFDLLRSSACLLVLTLPISGCAVWPLQFGHAVKGVANLPADESSAANVAQQVAESHRAAEDQEEHFASMKEQDYAAADEGRLVLREGDPRRLADLRHAPVGRVEEAALDTLPGTLQARSVRVARSVMVSYHPRAVPFKHFSVSALHVPEVVSQGLHRPSLVLGEN